jgi:peroxiredoxin
MRYLILAGLAAVTTSAAAIAMSVPAASPAEPALGAAALDFTARDAAGNNVQLAKYKGKTIILEWHNPGCPFVKKHYQGNMQKTQAAAVAQGAVWLTINSGAPGEQGHMDGATASALVAKEAAKSTHYLLDPGGQVGKAYGARTTPHMYVIDPAGKLVYRGAIDDKPTSNVADIATARNHVLEALKEVKAGKPVSVADTRPYGCSVKYAS